MAIRILCTGDMHLGRRPTRIPENSDSHSLRPTVVWHSLVSTAIERKVDAVVLTGDVVDESNKFFEAFSALQSGVEHLAKAGIPVLTVSGNHDFEHNALLETVYDKYPAYAKKSRIRKGSKTLPTGRKRGRKAKNERP